MGITFADIVDKSREVKIEFNGASLLVGYDPSALSPAKLSKMNKDLKKAESGDEDTADEDLLAVGQMFCSIVKTWDLVGPLGEDDDGEPLVPEGEPVAVTPQNVSWLPSPIIGHIMEKVSEDAAPKAKKRR